MTRCYLPLPTIVPATHFDASADAILLRKAMKGFGTDEQAIIDILCARSNAQRQEISKAFNRELDRDLMKDLQFELGGNFEDVILGLMLPPEVYLCQQIRKAIDGISVDEKALVEIICVQTNDQIKAITDCYKNMYDRVLVQHLSSKTSERFSLLLTMIIEDARDPPGMIDPELAVNQAKQLCKAGEDKFGTDEDVFYKILTRASFDQLRCIFKQYKNLFGVTIEQALTAEFSGELYDALSSIVECAQMTPQFFAKRLHEAMNGIGTDDATLIRIIVSRSEIDLQNIKDEFEQMYNKTLMSAIRSETSGDYKQTLCALIGSA
uniref:Annexin n=1 Tax=Anopheles farauti TaxID=69004 RepID=A0A182QKD1_9DIPT